VKPLESCRFENDDHPDSIHLCLKKEDIIIGVLSSLPYNCLDFSLKKNYQLRGVAINHEFQIKGIGSHLVQKVEQQIRLNKSN
jgi:N-acetylglutamate synthase-like GNAT family acetyltransferase